LQGDRVLSSVIAFAAVLFGTIAAAVIDLRTRRVPNILTGSLAATGVAIAFSGVGHVGLAASLLGLVLGVALMLPGHLLGGTGAGDVKLFAAVGTLLGPAGILYAFVYTAVAGGVLALVTAIVRGRGCRTVRLLGRLVTARATRDSIEHPSIDNRFAYAPAIAVGAVLVALGY
jgi:prepilin peptidase CpaA